MFEQATENVNLAYNNYVQSIVKNVESTIFIDIHGTGKRVLEYFKTHYNQVPYCFLISATSNDYDEFPDISQHWYRKGKLINLVFDARGSPIEMLNYDLVGTLQDYTVSGPVRDSLEYKKSWIVPYHECINTIIESLPPIDPRIKQNLKQLHYQIKKLFKMILTTKPIISEKIDHIGRHKVNDNVIVDPLSRLRFDKVINDSGVYGVIWLGSFNGETCAIKMVKLTSGRSHDYTKKSKKKSKKSKNPFESELFDDHKAMDPDAFIKETNNLLHLSKLGLSPKVYDCFLHQPSGKVHYGFIAMEKLDGSIKDILLRRSLSSSEAKIALNLIKSLHRDHHLVHGDLKPSNVGVRLDDNGKIKECLFIDCQKVKYRDDHSSDDFQRYIERDRYTFKSHYKQNRHSTR
jgi:tRNA A-37 threonylcarbamoyl transferase component Bud32